MAPTSRTMPPNQTTTNPSARVAELHNDNAVYAQAIKDLRCPRCAETRQVEVTQYLLCITAFCNTCAHSWKLG